jgi:hypothetical protein
MSEQILAWHGDPDLKARVVAKLKQHRALDEFIQGDYQVAYGPNGAATYKGCAIGCTLPYISREERRRRTGRAEDFDWHKEVEKEYGIPELVARLIDNIFEAQDDFEEAGDFAVAVIEAIPVGADLSGIACEGWPFCGQWFDYGRGGEYTDKFIEALAKAPVPE